MKIVVGLGNSGKRYANTPHNVGFMVLDRLAEKLAFRFRRSLRMGALIGKAHAFGECVWWVKPHGFMNNSGDPVGSVLHYSKAESADLLAVVDDADLPLGRLRIRPSGSSGGHRGLQSIIDRLGCGAFARLRVGIGRRQDGSSLVGHVLSPFAGRDRSLVERVVDVSADAVLCALDKGTEAAMNAFNGLDIE